MRFCAVKYEEEETVYYNPKTFHRDENLIIFPFNEFDNFYNELVQNLNVVKNIINDALNSNSPHPPLTDLERIKDWIDFIGEDVDLLVKFEMQTALKSFQGSNSAKIKSHKFQFMSLGNRSLQKSEIFALQKPSVFERFPQPPLKTLPLENKLPYSKEAIQCLIGL